MKPAYKICVCLGADWRNQWVVHAAEADLIELRIDLMFPKGITTSEVAETLSPLLHEYNHKTVLTCRPGTISQEERCDLFLALLTHNQSVLRLRVGKQSCLAPAYIDLEYNTPQTFRTPLYAAAQQNNTQIIASFHDFDDTPDTPQFHLIAHKAFQQGADLVKIVTRCHNAQDEARLMSLYSEPHFANRIIAFSLGQYALSSRLHAAAAGAPILYLAPDNGALTAPGQPRFSQFQHKISVNQTGFLS